jgi:AcrR family transcriptional regulator
LGSGNVMADSITPAVERRDRNRREMRETILAAARKILVHEGVSALSMRAVARDIGYSPASLYEYFPSKAALCQALFFEGATGLSGRIGASIAALPNGAPTDRVAATMGIAYRDFALENRELYLLVFSNPVAGFVPDADDRREASGGYEYLVDAMRKGVERGELRAMDADIAALAAWSVVHGFVMLEILGYVGDGTRESSDPVFKQLLSHVGIWHERRE